MIRRKKFLLIYALVYICLSLIVYFGLTYRLKNNFSIETMNSIIMGKSMHRDVTTDLCKYYVLGDPKDEPNYVKVGFVCENGNEVISTLVMSAIEDKTIKGLLNEYARIIGFDPKLIDENNFTCFNDDKVMYSEDDYKEIVRATSTIRCIQNYKDED